MLHGAVLHTVQKKWLSHPFYTVYAGPRLEIWILDLGLLDLRNYFRFYRAVYRIQLWKVTMW